MLCLVGPCLFISTCQLVSNRIKSHAFVFHNNTFTSYLFIYFFLIPPKSSHIHKCTLFSFTLLLVFWCRWAGRAISGGPFFSIAACHAIVFGQDFGRLRNMNDQLRWDRDRIEELNQVFKNFARVSWCCCIFKNYRPTQWHQKTTGEISKKTMWIWYGMILEGNGGKTHIWTNIMQNCYYKNNRRRRRGSANWFAHLSVYNGPWVSNLGSAFVFFKSVEA